MTCECKDIVCKPLKQDPVKDTRCLECDSFFHPFKWRYDCAYCGQSFCRRCCQKQNNGKNKMILCDRCILHRYHGESKWCKRFDEFMKMDEPEISIHRYIDHGKYGKPIFWMYNCEHGESNLIDVGMWKLDRSVSYRCIGHWDSKST